MNRGSAFALLFVATASICAPLFASAQVTDVANMCSAVNAMCTSHNIGQPQVCPTVPVPTTCICASPGYCQTNPSNVLSAVGDFLKANPLAAAGIGVGTQLLGALSSGGGGGGSDTSGLVNTLPTSPDLAGLSGDQSDVGQGIAGTDHPDTIGAALRGSSPLSDTAYMPYGTQSSHCTRQLSGGTDTLSSLLFELCP